jgi:hypothetical protein
LSRRRRAPALESDGGELLVICDDKGYVDDERRRMASSYAWSASSFASRNGAGRRLELHNGSVVLG